MKFCRWIGVVLFLAGLIALTGPAFNALAQDKKDAKKDDKKDDKKDKKDKKDTKEDKKDTKKDDKKDDGKTSKLQWKAFDPEVNKEFYQTLTTKTEQKMRVMGMEVTQNQNQTFYIQWTPLKKDKDNWVVKQKIVGVKMDIDIGGNKISFDSTVDQPQNPMTDFFKALLTLDLTFTISKDLKIEKIEGNEEFIKNLGKANPQMEPLLKAILSKDALTKMAEPTLFAFPPDDKKEWERTGKLDLGPIGSYETKYSFKDAGKEKDSGFEKIDVTAKLSYAAPPMGEKGKLPFAIESGQLTGTGTGTALFDPKNGRFEKYEMKMKIEKGELTIDIGGMKTKVDLDQDQTATVTTSNTNPVAETKKKKS